MDLSESACSLARVERKPGGAPRLIQFSRNTAGDDPWAAIDEEILSRPAAASVLMRPAEYQLLLVEAPDVERSELRAAIRWRIKDLIHFHVDDAVTDVFEVPDQKRQSSGRLMYAVAARAPRVRDHVDQARRHGLDLDVIDIPEMALRNIAGLLDGDVRGVVSLYLAPSGGLITVTRQGTLYLARRIDVGEDRLAAADSEERPRLLDNISLEIQRSMDYYDSHFDQPPVGSVALMPTAVEMPFLKEHLTEALDVPIQEVDLSQLMDVDGELELTQQARGLLAIGAALRQEEVVL